MQPQYSQGAAPSHHPPPYAPPEVSQANGGSITSSLRQWRKKDYLEKQQSTEQPQTSVAENPSHVARVAPHTYYPRLTNDVCHYQHQYSEYGVPYKPPAPTPVKYSEIVDNPRAQTIEHITPVIPKLKDKEFGDLCSVAPQPHLKQYQDQMTMKQSYPDGTKQTYSDPTLHHQYISKDSQIHPFLQKQSQMHQYMQKEPYQQFLPKYGMQGQYPQSYPSEPNNFLAHLNKINPRMAQSIINDTHLRDPQIPMYHSLEQNRSYPQPQRMYHAQLIHSSPTHAHTNIPPSYNYAQPYNYNVKSSMQPNDPYNRVHQYQHNVPKYLPEYKLNAPIEQPIPNISPQRMYNESVHMNYAPMPPKISPNYPHCSQLEYAQHYQHRRAHLAQEYYNSHSAYKSGYVQNPQVSPEGGVPDSRTRKSSLKQYLETWVEEDMSGNLPDLVVSNNLNDVENMENLKGTMCIKGSGTQEQPLYVLDTTEIPNETLPHFLHLQQFEKLPDNIRGYYNVMPPGSRRIIIENNSPEGLPENGQVIRGHCAPIVPKISEGFIENGNVVAIENEVIVNQSAAENQRKIIPSEETSVNMGRGLENQIQNLENKVVQIHIIEDSEATTNSSNSSSDITATLNTQQRNTSSSSDTVIIQTNVYQNNAAHTDQFAKIIDNDESCVIKERIPQVEEESHVSTPSESETKIQSEDGIKNMPVIDESLGESTENEIAKEKEIFIPPKDTSSNHTSVQEDHTEVEISEDLQACENVCSRRSSICSIYKEMEHIHGENSNTALTNNVDSNNIKESKTTNSENVSNNFDPNQTIPEEDNCKNLCSDVNSGNKTNDLQQNSDETGSCTEKADQNKFEELNAKDEHSKLETVNSHTSENCDASDVSSATDLTNFTNPEISLCASKDKVELSETECAKIVNVPNEVQETVLEDHRHVSKKLRTAKVTAPNIPEESTTDGRGAVQELICASEIKQINNNINSATEFFEENEKTISIVEDENDTAAAVPFEDNEVVSYIKDNLLLDTKETNCTENDEISKNCATNCQSSNESLKPTKENVFDKTRNETKLLETSEETHMLDELNRTENLSPLPVEDVQIAGNNKKDTTSQLLTANTDFETTQVEEENEETTNAPNNELIIKDTPSNSKESGNKTSNQNDKNLIELENVENTEQTNSVESVTKTTAKIKNTENCEEFVSPIETSKNAEENVTSLAESDRNDRFLDEVIAENYIQMATPLNLSIDKKCVDNIPKAKTNENYVETFPHIYDNQMENASILDNMDDHFDTKFISENNEISKPENLSLLVENPKKCNDVSYISDTSNAKSRSKRAKSRPSFRKKETVKKPKAKGKALADVSRKEENSKSEKFYFVQKSIKQQDVVQTNATSNVTELKTAIVLIKENLAKCTDLDLVADTENTFKLSSASNDKVNTTPTEGSSALVEEEISKSENLNLLENNSSEKVDMPKLVAISNTERIETKPTSKTEEVLGSKNSIIVTSAKNLVNDTSNTEPSETTMPVLKCMVNYNEELNSSSISINNNDMDLEDRLKSDTFTNKIKKIVASKSKNAIKKIENRLSKASAAQKRPPKTAKKTKYKEKMSARESNLRRKSRRLNKESKEEQQTSMPHLVKENIVQITEVVDKNPQNIYSTQEHIAETVLIYNNFENTIEKEIDLQSADLEHQESVKETAETTLCTNSVLERKTIEEETEIFNNLDQIDSSNDVENIMEQTIPSEKNSCYSQKLSNISEDVTNEHGNVCFQENEPEEESEPTEIATEQAMGNQEEDFENNDTSIVYQINDTNVVLQIADELLEINVTTQNGRKIISVKTFSDAIIMNNSEETNCQTIADECAMEYEDSNSTIEIQDQKLCENASPLNNNCIDVCNTSVSKNTNTDIVDEANFCFKEICTETDIATVGDDVFIYNEEVVSSSTEIETVSKLPNNKEEQTETVTDDKNLQRKYITRKSSKREKKVSWEDEKYKLDKIKCLAHGSQKKSPKDGILKPKVHPNISESSSNKTSATIKDSLRKSPKTKAALKFVETIKPPITKVKEPKVPSKTTDNLKIHPNVQSDNPAVSEKIVRKLPKKLQLPMQQNSIKDENRTDSNIKNVPKQKYHNQNIINKNESHNNSNKNEVNDIHSKIEEQMNEIHKAKEKNPNKDLEKPKEINVQLKIKRSLSPKVEKSHHNKSTKLTQTLKKKLKIDKVNDEPQKTAASKVQLENRKSQKQKAASEETSLKNIKGNIKKEEKEITENSKSPKEVQNKIKTTSKSTEEQLKVRSKQKIEVVVGSLKNEEPTLEESPISVQENSITSSTSQETEASIKQRSNKLIQQITDDWDDDSDDLKTAENACKRRLSLQEYNSRKGTSSITEQETVQCCDFNKPDLTDNLFSSSNVLIGNKINREISPESPVLSVKFNNKTYSRNSSVYPLKPKVISNNSDHEQEANSKETNIILNYKKEEPLSSAIELHLPRINRLPRPAYNQEYLRNALMNDLQAVNAYTTTLIKDNQQLMQRFLEQKRLTADELKKVKTIIRYKRLVQHLSTIRINEMQTTSVRDGHAIKTDTVNILYPTTNVSLNSATYLKLTSNLSTDNCDVNKRQSNVNQIITASEMSTKMNQLHSEETVKVNVEKRKKKRFRFLYSDEETESHNSSTLSSTALTNTESNLKRPRLDISVPALDKKVMDYSVHQGNSQGQLTLVFKRSFKSDPKMQPFVRLERLPSIDLLAKNGLY